MRRYAILLVFLLLPAVLFGRTAVIYHTSDTHGFYYPSHGQGGFAALSAVLAGEKYPYILLDGGDFANGAPEAVASKGLSSAMLMNRAGYSAATLGNHEFYLNDAQLSALLSAVGFPVLAANLVSAQTGVRPPELEAYRIFDVGGVRLAVIGLASRQIKSARYQLLDDEFAVEFALRRMGWAQECQARLQNSDRLGRQLHATLCQAARERGGADAVILLAHNSPDNPGPGGKDFLARVPELFASRIQAVLGGHVHQQYQKMVNGVLFAESGYALQGVSRLEVQTDDETGKLISIQSSYIPLVLGQTGQDAAMKNAAETVRLPGLDETLGVAPAKLTTLSSDPHDGAGPLSYWLADEFKQYTQADVFVHNNGASRTDLAAGEFTRRDLENMCPFDNTFVTFALTGAQLRGFVARGLLPHSAYAYGGLTATYQVQNGQVTDLQIRVNGQPLQKQQIYRVATNSYLGYGTAFGFVPAEEKRQAGEKTQKQVMQDAFAGEIPHSVPVGRLRRLPAGK